MLVKCLTKRCKENTTFIVVYPVVQFFEAMQKDSIYFKLPLTELRMFVNQLEKLPCIVSTVNISK